MTDFDLRNRIDHVQSHFNRTMSMVWSSFWQARYTVVAITQKFDPQAMMFSC